MKKEISTGKQTLSCLLLVFFLLFIFFFLFYHFFLSNLNIDCNAPLVLWYSLLKLTNTYNNISKRLDKEMTKTLELLGWEKKSDVAS